MLCLLKKHSDGYSGFIINCINKQNIEFPDKILSHVLIRTCKLDKIDPYTTVLKFDVQKLTDQKKKGRSDKFDFIDWQLLLGIICFIDL